MGHPGLEPETSSSPPAGSEGRQRSLATGAPAGLDARLIVELDSLESLYAEWDALAVSSALPLMAPGWVLAWWRHIAPNNARLRAVEIRDDTELVGFAPFFVVPPRRGGRVDYRLAGLGRGSPLAPLALPGRERQVAQAISQALSRADPRPDVVALDGTRLASHWHVAMRDGWPGRLKPITRVYRTAAYPTVSLRGASLETWLAGRSNKFRSSMRRLRRRFDEQGGVRRMSTEATLRSDIETFQRLHAARWAESRESTFVDYGQPIGAMLNDAGRTLIAGGRFRLWMMEIDGQAIGADIYLCAGGVVVGVNGGWDDRWKRLSPPLLATMHTIEDSINRGEWRLELGPGQESHKTRFADRNDPVAWSVLMTPGRRLPQTCVLTAPMLASSAVRNVVKRVLAPQDVNRLRELRGGLRR
jgi:CelD/BcsL family acetyltransferase involved in cellulose biosynthesis